MRSQACLPGVHRVRGQPRQLSPGLRMQFPRRLPVPGLQRQLVLLLFEFFQLYQRILDRFFRMQQWSVGRRMLLWNLSVWAFWDLAMGLVSSPCPHGV